MAMVHPALFFVHATSLHDREQYSNRPRYFGERPLCGELLTGCFTAQSDLLPIIAFLYGSDS